VAVVMMSAVMIIPAQRPLERDAGSDKGVDEGRALAVADHQMDLQHVETGRIQGLETVGAGDGIVVCEAEGGG
jgi:hypothetical protein